VFPHVFEDFGLILQSKEWTPNVGVHNQNEISYFIRS